MGLNITKNLIINTAVKVQPRPVSLSQSQIFASGSKSGGSNVNTYNGATLKYWTVPNLTITGSTVFTSLPLASRFGGTNNVFGVDDYGTHNATTYFDRVGSDSGIVTSTLLYPMTGKTSATITGNFSGKTTTGAVGSLQTWNWKFVNFDGVSTYTTLGSGTMTLTSLSSGTLTATGTTNFGTLVSSISNINSWVGLFVQGSGATNAAGTHFNATTNLNYLIS